MRTESSWVWFVWKVEEVTRALARPGGYANSNRKLRNVCEEPRLSISLLT